MRGLECGKYNMKNKKMKISTMCLGRQLFTIILLFCSLIIIINDKYTELINESLAIILLIISIWLLYLVRENIFLSVIYAFILYSNYSIVIAIYLFPEMQPSMYSQITDLYTLGKALLMLVIFMLIQVVLLPDRIAVSKKLEFTLNDKKTNYIFTLGLIMILCLILIFGWSGPEVSGDRGSFSTYYEYSLIVFILGFYYSGKCKWLKNVLVGILLSFVMINFVYGARASAIKLLIFLGLFYFYKKLNFIKMVPFMFVGIICMISIGMFRANILSSTNILEKVVLKLASEKLTFNTAYWAYFPSLTFVKLRDEILSAGECLGLFKNFIQSIFIGQLATDWNLASYTRDYYIHWNGGVYPQYGYAWLGWSGMVLFSFIPAIYARLINNLNINSSVFKQLLVFYIVACTPRWYLYSNNDLIRGALIFFLLYKLTTFIEEILWGNKRENRPT